MTRKDYVAVAAIFNDAVERASDFERFAVVKIITQFADYAKQSNTSFNRDKFYRAAGVGHLAAN